MTRAGIAFRTGTVVGGASVPMDGAHFRAPQKTFDARDREGHPYWPDGYSRAVLDSDYARVEQMLHVRQFGWNEIPKAGGLFAKMLDAAGASCDRARLNYTDCNHCAQGCTFDKKRTLLHSCLPLAESHGVEVRSPSLVDHIDAVGSLNVVDRDRASYDAYLDRMDAALADVSAKSGVTLLPIVPRRLSGTTCAHLLSACRMADTKERGVADSNGRVFDYENLCVCDASAVPYALGVNPALTISAIAERTAEFVVERG